MGEIKDISEKFIEEKLNPKQGQKRTEVLAYPDSGFDFSIIGISDDKVMGMSSESALYLPELTPDKSAYLTFHRSADLLGASGIIPEYMGINLTVPGEIDEDNLVHYWNSLNIESKKFQASITGRCVRVSREAGMPFIGGVTSIGTSMKVFHVTPEGAANGDRILMTKTAGLETATLLAHLFPEVIEEKIGQYNHKLAQKLFFKTSTLQEVQEAVKFGLGKSGITSMMNVRGKGITGALRQYSGSGGMGLEVEFESIPVYDEVKEICSMFELDPYSTDSMGSLLLTMPGDISEDFAKELVGNGIDVADIGSVNRDSNVVRISGHNGENDSSNGSSRLYDLIYENLRRK